MERKYNTGCRSPSTKKKEQSIPLYLIFMEDLQLCGVRAFSLCGMSINLKTVGDMDWSIAILAVVVVMVINSKKEISKIGVQVPLVISYLLWMKPSSNT